MVNVLPPKKKILMKSWERLHLIPEVVHIGSSQVPAPRVSPAHFHRHAGWLAVGRFCGICRQSSLGRTRWL